MSARMGLRAIAATRHQLSRSASYRRQISQFNTHRTFYTVSRAGAHGAKQYCFECLPLALLASSAIITAQCEAPAFEEDKLTPLSRMEENTGVSFPVSLSASEELSGLGARFMGGLVKVYAVGIYLDSSAARVALADWKGFSAEEIVTADPLWKELCSADAGFSRTVRMVVVRNVDGKHMQNGFEKALLGRVAAAAKRGRCRPRESKHAALEFCALFKNIGTMKEGSDVRISIERDVATLVIDGRFIGEVRNVQLTWALLDMFVGEKGVIKGLREEVAKGLERVLEE